MEVFNRNADVMCKMVDFATEVFHEWKQIQECEEKKMREGTSDELDFQIDSCNDAICILTADFRDRDPVHAKALMRHISHALVFDVRFGNRIETVAAFYEPDPTHPSMRFEMVWVETGI